jgi:hypothetical protein
VSTKKRGACLTVSPVRGRNENHLSNGFFGACRAGQPSCGSPRGIEMRSPSSRKAIWQKQSDRKQSVSALTWSASARRRVWTGQSSPWHRRPKDYGTESAPHINRAKGTHDYRVTQIGLRRMRDGVRRLLSRGRASALRTAPIGSPLARWYDSPETP